MLQIVSPSWWILSSANPILSHNALDPSPHRPLYSQLLSLEIHDQYTNTQKRKYSNIQTRKQTYKSRNVQEPEHTNTLKQKKVKT